MNAKCKGEFESLNDSLLCKICYDHWSSPCAIPCGHIFCNQCIEGLFKHHSSKCPLCTMPFSKRNVVQLISLVDVISEFKNFKTKMSSELILSQTSNNNTIANQNSTSTGLSFQELNKMFPYPDKLQQAESSSTTLQSHLQENSGSNTDDAMEGIVKRVLEFQTEDEKLHFLQEEKQKRIQNKKQIEELIKALEDENNMFDVDRFPILHDFADSSQGKRFFQEKKIQEKPLETSSSSHFSTSTTPAKPIVNHVSYSSFSKPVIVGTILNPIQKEILNKVAEQLDCKIVDKFCPQVTHVVSSTNENRVAKRTLKYSFGVVTGCWVVCFDWIENSLKQKAWLQEDAYEVLGDVEGFENRRKAPCLGRQAKLQNESKLFEGMSFVCHGTFQGSDSPAKTDLIQLLELGGARVLKLIPKKMKQHEEFYIIVGDFKAESAKDLKQLETVTGATVISSAWVLDSISHYNLLDMNKYSLVSVESSMISQCSESSSASSSSRNTKKKYTSSGRTSLPTQKIGELEEDANIFDDLGEEDEEASTSKKRKKPAKKSKTTKKRKSTAASSSRNASHDDSVIHPCGLMLLKVQQFFEKKTLANSSPFMSKINGVETEWTLIQRQLGNLPPAEEEEKDEFEVPDEKQQRMAYLQKASIGKLEAEMDKRNLGDEDEDFLEQLKKKRMDEMRQKLADQKYGRYSTIQASEFIKEVNEAGNGIYVIVHLFADGKEDCQVLDESLQQLCLEHRYAKFVRVKGSLAIPNFPDRNCPTILIYYEGTMKLQFTGLSAFGGIKHCSPKTIEWALAAAKVLKTTMKQPPKILAGNSSTKMNFISKRSTRRNNDSDSEEDEEDDDDY